MFDYRPPPAYHQKFSNGKVWIEFVSSALNMPLIDLAIGGATIDAMKVQGKTGPTESWPVAGLQQQYEQHKLNKDKNKTTNEAHIICGGNNDYYFLMVNDPTMDSSTAVQATVESIMELVRSISEGPQATHIFVCDLFINCSQFASPPWPQL